LCSNGIRIDGQGPLLFWVKLNENSSRSKKPTQVIFFAICIHISPSLEASVGLFLTSSFIGAVLSNQRKRTLYDSGSYDPDDEEDEVGILEMFLTLFHVMLL